MIEEELQINAIKQKSKINAIITIDQTVMHIKQSLIGKPNNFH